jgi:hypothetical protein
VPRGTACKVCFNSDSPATSLIQLMFQTREG